jgi:hypothetical protein
MNNIFTMMDGGNCPQEKGQQGLCRTDHQPGNNDTLILTRLLLPGDDSENFSSDPPWYDQPGTLW